MRNFLIRNILITAAVAVVFVFAGGGSSAIAALYGGMTAVCYGLIQHWYMQRAGQLAGTDAHRSLRLMYRCTLERFIAAAALLTLGLGLLKLAAAPLITGFIVGVVGQVLNNLTRKV